MTTISAAVCRQFGRPLQVERLTIADPGRNQIRVAVKASAICHSDLHFFEGSWGGELPAVWGHEAAGIVESVGEGVTGFRPGDRVVTTLIRSCGECRNCQRQAAPACTGAGPAAPTPLTDEDGNPVGHGLGTAAFAEMCVVDRSQAVVVDAGVAMEPAALLACGVITGVGAALNTAEIDSGSTVVVIGVGGVGLNSVQGARLARAKNIIAVDVSATKLEHACRFGATHTIDSSLVDLNSTVFELTGGKMADYVLVTVGAPEVIENAPYLLAPNGALVVVGMPASGVTVGFDPVRLASLNQAILGSKMGAATISRDVPDLVDRYKAGDLMLDELITNTYPLTAINDAIESVYAGDAIRNMIVFG